MSEAKLREALIYIEGLAVADEARDLATIADVARQALAQPAEAVELTDEELVRAMYHGVVAADSTVINDVEGMVQDLRDNEPETLALVAGLRALIAAHEAKRRRQ